MSEFSNMYTEKQKEFYDFNKLSFSAILWQTTFS